MQTYKVLCDFSSNKYSDSGLLVLGNQVIKLMTGNTYFPTPIPTLALLQANLDFYEAAIAKTKNGTRQDIIDKNAARLAFEEVLRALAGCVQTQSAGNAAAIISSGFDINKMATPSNPLYPPTDISVEAGATRGSLFLSWNPVKNAHSYLVEYTEVPFTATTVWRNAACTKSSITISNLTRGCQYALHVISIGSNPTRLPSDDLFSFVM
jgi:hypothetical protein